MSTPADRIRERLGTKPKDTSAADRIRARLRGDPAADMFNQPSIDRSGAPFNVRQRVARGDTLEEKNRILQKRFPNAVVERTPVTGELMYKIDSTDPNEQFKSIERGPNETFAFREVAKDVGEFVMENAGPIIGETAATINPLMRGARIGRTALSAAGGAAAGELAEQGLQARQGVSTESLEDMVFRAGQEGVASGAGAAVAPALLNPLINTAIGAGGISQRPGAAEAERARQFLNRDLSGDSQIPPFTPGQVSETPILQRLDEQSIALAGGLRQQRRDQIAGVARATRQSASGRDFVRARQRAEIALNTERRKLSNSINTSVNFDDAGASLKDSLSKYSKQSQRIVSDLYDKAAEMAPGEGPVFDLSAPLRVADELSAGVRAASREGGVVDAQGALAPELQSVINDLRNIDPNFPVVEGSAPSWQVLDNLRQRLFDLKTPNPGEPFRRSHRQASQLYSAITDTLDNPAGAEGAFAEAWDAARRTAKTRFDNLELSNIVRLARTDETTGFARRLAQPGSADALRQLGSVLDERAMRQVTDAFKSDLASSIDTIGEKLIAYDNETLSRLVSPSELSQLREVEALAARLRSTNVQQALENQSRNRLFVRNIIRRDDSAGATNLVEMIQRNGGVRGDLGNSIRAGIIDDFFSDVVNIQADGGKVSVEVLEKRMKKLNDLGLRRLLTPDDMKKMRAVIQIAPFVKVSRGGAGASIQAADVGENIISFGDPKSQIGGIFSVIQKIGYARTMQNPMVRRILIGGGRERVNPIRSLALTGAVLGTALPELEREGEQ